MTEILTFNYLLLIRLVAAVICGGIIGWERGGTRHEARSRTQDSYHCLPRSGIYNGCKSMYC